jgi:dTDP-glucose pyrophosphorylase
MTDTKQITKAVILAAGRGTRMGPLTGDVPKPMLTVKGKPILQHIIEGIQEAGIGKIHIIVGYKANMIEDFFKDGRDIGIDLTYSHQRIQNGTGKAPELAKKFVDYDPFLLTYGDILVNAETYRQMIERFGDDNVAAVVAATLGEEVSKGGMLIFDDRFCLDTLVEKPTVEDLRLLEEAGKHRKGDPVWYNAGIYVFQRSLFDFTRRLAKSPRGEYELTDAITAMNSAGHTIAGQKIHGSWADVRDPEVLKTLDSRGSE